MQCPILNRLGYFSLAKIYSQYVGLVLFSLNIQLNSNILANLVVDAGCLSLVIDNVHKNHYLDLHRIGNQSTQCGNLQNF